MTKYKVQLVAKGEVQTEVKLAPEAIIRITKIINLFEEE